MRVIYNSQEFVDLCPKFIKMVKTIKHYSTLKIRDDSDFLNASYMMRSVLQGGNHLQFQSARIFHISNQHNMVIGIGTPAVKPINIIEIDLQGVVRGFCFYKKSDKLEIQVRNDWGGHHDTTVLDIPKYDYHSFEEQMFQLSCTEDFYYVLRFFMEMKIAFNSNLYVDMRYFDFDKVFVEGRV